MNQIKPTPLHKPGRPLKHIIRNDDGTIAKRSINFRHKEPVVSTNNRERILRWYRNDTPLLTIIKKLNPGKPSHECLSLPDVYAVLADAKAEGEIKSRSSGPLGEFTIEQFIQFYRAWQDHLSLAVCISRTVDLKSKAFAGQVHRALMKRFNGEQDRARLTERVAKQRTGTEGLMAMVLLTDFAKAKIVDDNVALVIFPNSLPSNLKAFVSQMPQLANILNPSPLNAPEAAATPPIVTPPLDLTHLKPRIETYHEPLPPLQQALAPNFLPEKTEVKATLNVITTTKEVSTVKTTKPLAKQPETVDFKDDPNDDDADFIRDLINQARST